MNKAAKGKRSSSGKKKGKKGSGAEKAKRAGREILK